MSKPAAQDFGSDYWQSSEIQFGANHDQVLEAFCDEVIEQGLIEPLALERAKRAARTSGERVDRVLTKLGLVSEADLVGSLSRFCEIPLGWSDPLPGEPVLAGVLSYEYVRRNALLPLAQDGKVVRVAITDPFNSEGLRAVAFVTGLEVRPCLVTTADLEKAVATIYMSSDEDQARADSTDADAIDVDVERLRDLASEAPTIRLVNLIIANAVDAKASDIHIEPEVDALYVRYRIDGLLRTDQQLSPHLRSAVTSRIKIMARLDIAERRLPQDGRIKIAVRGIDIDFRISTVPTVWGESVVMRILDRSRVELDFAKLGFDVPDIETLQQLLRQPNGIVLVTGPTGSGKTTTLYTALKNLNTTERKLVTVEDPIEYQLAHVNQIQVHAAIGLDFPQALRAILRQDPDIIMIGEIRDAETARIAVQAALTGHLVLSTLHTNSAAAAITRLIDMGIERFLLSSTLRAVLAQRLVRRLCPACAGPHLQSGALQAHLASLCETSELGPPQILEGRGCHACNGQGYVGRTTVYEILHVSPEIAGLLQDRASDAAIDATARAGGMKSLAACGAAKVWRGETTLHEVLRVTEVQ